MPFLTVAGVTVVVDDRSATQSTSDEIGGEARAFDGTLRSSVRARKRNWSFTSFPMTQADMTTLRAAAETGTGIVSCAGDALGATISCRVRVEEVPYIRDRRQASDFSRQVSLSLAEA